MEQLLIVIALTSMAGLAMPLGALIARFENIGPDWLEEEFRHSVMAFGAGALLSAIALVLVPEGIEPLTPPVAATWFIVGGLVFMWLDILLYRKKTSASQMVAMLADFIPESLALGAAFALGGSSATLLALLMMLQNLPEGFNAYRELRESTTYSPGTIIGLFALMALLGPLAGVAGYLWLAAYPEMVGAIMLFAAGGILYSIFEDIAPQVPLEKSWAPPMGGSTGICAGFARPHDDRLRGRCYRASIPLMPSTQTLSALGVFTGLNISCASGVMEKFLESWNG